MVAKKKPAEDGTRKGAAPDRMPEELPAKASPLQRAQVMAPKLTQEFVDEHQLDDEHLAGIARGEIPPPPTVGPIHNVDLHLTSGGWQVTPKGVKPEDVGKDGIGNAR